MGPASLIRTVFFDCNHVKIKESNFHMIDSGQESCGFLKIKKTHEKSGVKFM